MKLYYEDGTVYEGAPECSPVWGVVAVGQPHQDKVGKALKNGYAYLYRTDWDCWMEVGDLTGFNDHIAHFAHLISAVRFGRQIRDDWFMEIKREVETAAGIRRTI